MTLAANASNNRLTVAWTVVLLLIAARGLPAMAQSTVPAEARAAVSRAVTWLKANSTTAPGRASLSAYAFLQAGDPPSAPEVQQAIAEVLGRIADGVYTNRDHYAHYVAAVDIMLLEATDPVGYREQIEAITKFLTETQRANGYWDYPGEDRGGDTSQTQYALLGLWAARRAGIDVPDQTWDRAAQWLMSTQDSSGGSAYTPRGQGRTEPTYTMTTATIGSLALIRRMLHGESRRVVADDEAPPEPNRKFGVLDRVDFATPEGQAEGANTGPYKVQSSVADLEGGIRKGMGWYVPRYRIGTVDNQLYYLYGLERMAALLEADTLAGHDWYAEGIAYLLQSQQDDGRWSGGAIQDEAGTALAVLFIMRATSKLLGRPPKGVDVIGSGLLKGGRGLPSDLSQALLDDGKVQSRKIDDPIEKLLAQLEQQDAPQVEAVQQAIVEQVQLGNREELIGQKDRLVRLAQHPDPEIRRTSLWALGRSDDLKLIELMVRSLRDPDLGVRIEAHNALCALSRKPNGFEGLANDPLEGVAEDASEQDRQAAIERWTAAAHEKWRAWYLTVRPYDERDDLQEPKARTGRP